MQSLYYFSRIRLSWLLLLACMTAFEGTGLIFQHIMKLSPCVMCIYERVAMVGISGAAIIGLLNPNNLVFRWCGFIVWGMSASWGLKLALEHVNYQLNPSPFATCDLFVTFPAWAPLNKWAPWMFEAYGDCSKIVWQFLTLTMPQWVVIIFAGNLLILALFVAAQFFNKKEA